MDKQKILECIGLLSSMVSSGEDHSDTSRKLIEEAKLELASCEHEFEFIDTEKKCESVGRYAMQWKKVDRFFCKKCLEQKEKRLTHDGFDSKGKPDWY